MVVTRSSPAAAETLSVADAYRWCHEYVRRHQENFTVISWVLPKELRPHFASVYSFCRWTDDLGDEADGDRLALLDAWEESLRACYTGDRTAPLFVALGKTIEQFDIPMDPFLRLIEANRMDQRQTRYATYDDLLAYCENSATPVGRLVLYVLGYSDARRQALADATCIGLQLANFWQDVTVDYAKGRVYLPQEDLRRFDIDEDDVISRREPNAQFCRLMRFEVERTRTLFREGAQLERLISRHARADVRLFRLGGEAVLDAIEAARFDVLTSRPRIPRQRKAWLALSAGVRMKLGI